jgi:hypothetical protein
MRYQCQLADFCMLLLLLYMHTLQAMFLLVPDPSLEDAGLRELWRELQIKVC